MTTVMVVDDHSVVRMGLTTLLSRTAGLQMVGEAASAAEAIQRALDLSPDVILMDVRLPDGNGIECCRIIRAQRPQTRVLLLTSYDDQDAMMAAVLAGASGYLLKQVDPEQLLEAIRQVAAGESLLDPAAARLTLAFARAARPRTAPADELTDRECSILNLVGEGATNREIAARLYLSEKTVRNYVSTILEKLNLSNRTQAAAYVSRKRQQNWTE